MVANKTELSTALENWFFFDPKDASEIIRYYAGSASSDLRSMTLRRLHGSSLGVQLSGRAISDLLDASGIDTIDLSFRETVKTLDVVQRVRGIQALLSNDDEGLLRGYDALETALEMSPSDAFLNLLQGSICAALADGLALEKEADDPETINIAAVAMKKFQRKSEEFFRVSVAKRDTEAALFYSSFLLKQDRFKEAEELLLSAVEWALDDGVEADPRAIAELKRILDAKDDMISAVRSKELSSFISPDSRQLRGSLQSQSSPSVARKSPTKDVTEKSNKTTSSRKVIRRFAKATKVLARLNPAIKKQN